MHTRCWSLIILSFLAWTACTPTQSPATRGTETGTAGPRSYKADALPGTEAATVDPQREEVDALEDVLMDEFRTVYAAIQSDPVTAEAKLAALKSRLPSLGVGRPATQLPRDQAPGPMLAPAPMMPPRTSTRELRKMARESITALEERIARSRFTLPDLEAKLRANPDDTGLIRMYEEKAADAVLAQTFTDPSAASKTIDAVKAVLETVKPATDSAKTALAQARASFTLPEHMASVRRPRAPWDLEAHMKAYPDDIISVGIVKGNVIGRVAPLVLRPSSPPAPDRMSQEHELADAMYTRLEANLRSLKPTTEKGKAGLAKILEEVARFHEPLVAERMQKLSASDLDAILKANPDDAQALTAYARKALYDISFSNTPIADKEEELARLKARLESIKPTWADARREQAGALATIEGMKESFESERLTRPQLEARFRGNPNDIRALRMYVNKIDREINEKANARDAAAVDRRFAEVRALIATVKPTTAAAKDEKTNLGASVAAYESSIMENRLMRLSRSELEARLKANPADDLAWHHYRYKADGEIGPKMGSDKAAARKAIDEVQAMLRTVKPTSAKAERDVAELQKIIAGYDERFDRDRRAPLEIATLSEMELRLKLHPSDPLTLEYYLKRACDDITSAVSTGEQTRADAAIGKLKTRLDALQSAADPRVKSLITETRASLAAMEEHNILLKATPRVVGAWLKDHPDHQDARHVFEIHYLRVQSAFFRSNSGAGDAPDLSTEIAGLRELYEALRGSTNPRVVNWRDQIMGSIVVHELRQSKASLSELGANLQAHSDDAIAVAKYVRKTSDDIYAKIRTDDKQGAERIRAEATALLKAIKPTTDEARSQVARAREEVKTSINQAIDSAARSAQYEQMRRQANASLPEMEARLKTNPDDATALEQYQMKAIQEIQEAIGTDPNTAEKRLDAFITVLRTVQENAGQTTDQRIDMFLGWQVKSIRQAIEQTQSQRSRIGRPAAPLTVDVWINGSPLTDAELRGKVVLLDFSWSLLPPGGMSPSLVAQLRTWSARYTDKGLIIISLTRYSRMVSQMTGPEQQKAMELEQSNLKDMARENGLTNRIAIQRSTATTADYGSPAGGQVVVIDRQAKVRLISFLGRTGALKAVDEMLEALLGSSNP